jgi:hypothetical protein
MRPKQCARIIFADWCSLSREAAGDYTAPFRFTGGTIDKVVVDVSGEKYVDPEAQVRGWFVKD